MLNIKFSFVFLPRKKHWFSCFLIPQKEHRIKPLNVNHQIHNLLSSFKEPPPLSHCKFIFMALWRLTGMATEKHRSDEIVISSMVKKNAWQFLARNPIGKKCELIALSAVFANDSSGPEIIYLIKRMLFIDGTDSALECWFKWFDATQLMVYSTHTLDVTRRNGIEDGSKGFIEMSYKITPLECHLRRDKYQFDPFWLDCRWQ